jgi:glyoxylase-like metal-dependent hydrolase (beta-lactamase superfamily II)
MAFSQWPDILPRPGNRHLEQVPGVDPWFEIRRAAPSTFALLEPRHYEEVISYLILGSERAVLFDTGMGIGDIRAEVDRLTPLPVVVVNSHGHYDHVGDNHRFAEVWAFDDDGEVARIEKGKPRAECAEYVEPGWYLDLPPGFDPAAYEIRPSTVTRRLHHLERIELGGRTLTVHHTPGHSAGSLCLLDSRSRLLFTGDTYYPGMMYAHFEDSDFDAYRQAIAYLVGLLDQVRHLCPAHNEAYVPKDRLKQVAAAFEQIAAGQVPFQVEDGIRVYRFEGSGLTLPLIPT